MADEIDAAPEYGREAFPDETAEEAVTRIVAQNPAKHGTTLDERLARARASVTRMIESGADLSDLSAEDATIVAIGGDPNEMMVGNKPRYTVQEDGSVKDHETGEVHGAIGSDDIPESPGVVEQAGASGNGVGSQHATQAETKPATEPVIQEQRTAALQRVVDDANALANQATCAHTWSEDPDEETRCPGCGITFEEWVNS